MTHALVEQLRFARSEFLRGMDGVSAEDARRHFGRMNSIGWIVGHLASLEQSYWLETAQGKIIYPALKEHFAFGAPMSTPELDEVRMMWDEVTVAADPFLDGLTRENMLEVFRRFPSGLHRTYGSALLRVTYHYYFHTGEILAIRQLLDQRNLPEFVGHIDSDAPYRPE